MTLNNRFKYGLCTWYLPVQSMGVRFASEQGYEAVSISDHGGSDLGFPLNDPDIQRVYVENSKKYGTKLHNLTLTSFSVNGFLKQPVVSEGGKTALRTFEMALKACVAMGIESLTALSAGKSRITTEQELDNTADNLRYAGKLAKDCGVELSYESFSDLDSTLLLREKTDCCFKLIFDPTNCLRYGLGDPLEYMLRLKPESIAAIHMKDTYPDLCSDSLLGYGVGNIGAIASAIWEWGYRDWILNNTNYFNGSIGSMNASRISLMQKDLYTLKTMLQRI